MGEESKDIEPPPRSNDKKKDDEESVSYGFNHFFKFTSSATTPPVTPKNNHKKKKEDKKEDDDDDDDDATPKSIPGSILSSGKKKKKKKKNIQTFKFSSKVELTRSCTSFETGQLSPEKKLGEAAATKAAKAANERAETDAKEAAAAAARAANAGTGDATATADAAAAKAKAIASAADAAAADADAADAPETAKAAAAAKEKLIEKRAEKIGLSNVAQALSYLDENAELSPQELIRHIHNLWPKAFKNVRVCEILTTQTVKYCDQETKAFGMYTDLEELVHSESIRSILARVPVLQWRKKKKQLYLVSCAVLFILDLFVFEHRKEVTEFMSTQHVVLCSFAFIILAAMHMVVVWCIGMPYFFKKKQKTAVIFKETSRQLFTETETETEKKDDKKKNN